MIERRIRYATLVVCTGLGLAASASAQTVTDLESGAGLTPETIASSLIGGGVTISNVTYTGSPRALGLFDGAMDAVGFGSGVVLSSGKVQTREGDPECSGGVEGPNLCHESIAVERSNSTAFGTPGDAELDGLSGFPTLDAAVLEFDFVPQFATIQFRYVFGSEEYNDFVNTTFNDVFAFYVNGVNCALVPGSMQPVSVNSVNNGNPGGDPTPTHPALFRDNVRPEPTIPIELDGLTTVFTCDAQVQAGVVNHMKLAIADASDAIFDSAVFIDAGSFVSGTSIKTQLTGGGHTDTTLEVPAGTSVFDSATLMGVNAATAAGFVSYTVYSDDTCSTPYADAGMVAVQGGSVPDSIPVVFDEPGTFFWVASYSGDDVNNPSESGCGEEVVVVTAPPPPPATSDCKLWYYGWAGPAGWKAAKVAGFAWGHGGKGVGDHVFVPLGRWHSLRFDAFKTTSVQCTEAGASLEGWAWFKWRKVRYRIDLGAGTSAGPDAHYRLVLSNGFDSGEQPLRHGKVVIRRR